MADKIYVNGISVKQSKYGLKMSGNAEKVIEQIRAHTNNRGYFNWDINPRREVGKYGETHSVTVDTWQPQSTQPTPQSSTPNDITEPLDSLPF